MRRGIIETMFFAGLVLIICIIGYSFYINRTKDNYIEYPRKFTEGEHILKAHLDQDRLMRGELVPIEYSIHDYSINEEYVRIPDYDIEIMAYRQGPDLSIVEGIDE